VTRRIVHPVSRHCESQGSVTGARALFLKRAATEAIHELGHAYQPVVKRQLRSAGEASPGAALLLRQILPVFSVVAPCPRGASPASMRRWRFTTGCYGLDHFAV
jgi:hypothetical protein